MSQTHVVRAMYNAPSGMRKTYWITQGERLSTSRAEAQTYHSKAAALEAIDAFPAVENNVDLTAEPFAEAGR